MEKRMKMDNRLANSSYYIFILFFPILPEFTHILGRPCYELLLVFTFVVYCISRNRLKFKGCLGIISLGFLLYALMYGYHGEYTAIFTNGLVCFLPILFVYNFVNTKERVEKSFRILLMGGVITCIFAIVESVTEFNVFALIQTIDADEPMGALFYEFRNGLVRVESSFGQPLPYAMYLVFINFISIICLVQRKREKRKPDLLIKLAYILSIITVYLTTARFALIVLIILQCFFVLTLSVKRKVLIIICLIIAAMYVLVSDARGVADYIFLILSVFNSKFYSYTSDGGQNVAYRFQLLIVLADYIKQKPIFGMGYAEGSKLTFKMVTPTSTWTAHSIDNNYLAYLVQYGIIGLIANSYIMVVGFVKCIKGFKRYNLMKWFLLILILYAMNLFSVYQMGERRLFTIIVGLIIATSKLSNHEDDGRYHRLVNKN